MDDRMVFYNNSSEDVFVRMIFIDDDITGTMVGLRKINSKSEKTVSKLYSWETEFENSKDSVLNIVIFKDYKFLNDKYEESNNMKSDSLLKIGDYQIYRYKYADLKNNNWIFRYPDDGFEQGRPVILGNDHKLIRTPNPEILKEKGFKNRWSKKDSI
jgi:hypothetical protein